MHHIGKQPSRCFYSEIHSATSAHGDSQLERDISINKTAEEWIWKEVKIYIVFQPSKMGNDRHWLCSWITNRNRWIKHTWVYARQHISVSVGGAACARSQTFSDVWRLDNIAEYLNTCKQTFFDVCSINNLTYQYWDIFLYPRRIIATDKSPNTELADSSRIQTSSDIDRKMP